MFLRDGPEDELAALELDVYDVLPKIGELSATIDYLLKVLDKLESQNQP
jgi:hypothetical protein